MIKISGELRSHYQRKVPFVDGNWLKREMTISTKLEWDKFGATVNRVRASAGYPIRNFRDLIEQVALVTINNRSYEMYYRGQTQDYLNNKGKYYSDRVQKSTIYPAICRPNRNTDGTLKYSVKRKEVAKRYKILYLLIDYIRKESGQKFPDVHYMALFQHYDILPTPLIDITQSLRVAATFALRKNKEGFLYVFGLPFPNQSVSYYTDFGLVLLKLQNIVPVNALRPRYQEGYLVGNFPFTNYKSEADDLSNRMVAKFKLDNKDGHFWDDDFKSMPEELLFPKKDAIEKELIAYKEIFFESCEL